MTAAATFEPVRQVRLAGQAAAPDGPLDMRGMYLVHHAFRRDLPRIAGAVADVPLSESHRLDAVFDHFVFVMRQLHDHHEREDELIWPALRKRRPERAADLDAVEAEHERLDKSVARTAELMGRLVAVPDEEGRTAALAALIDLHGLLDAHLAHEETSSVEIMQRTFTPEEWRSLDREVRRTVTLRDRPRMAAWLLEGVPGDVVVGFSDLPSALRPVERLAVRAYALLRPRRIGHQRHREASR